MLVLTLVSSIVAILKSTSVLIRWLPLQMPLKSLSEYERCFWEEKYIQNLNHEYANYTTPLAIILL